MAESKADKELVVDEKTGVPVAVPVGEDAPNAVCPKRSFRGGSKTGYTSHILIGGHKVYIREMTREEFRAVSIKRDAIDDALQEVQTLSTQEGIDRKQVKAAMDAAADRHAEFYSDVIHEHVKGWELPDDDGTPLPFTAQIVDEMPLSDKVEIVGFILQKSQLGKDESTF